jgi:hypothetical protein
MKKKRPFSEFSKIAEEGGLELTFCEMFRANGEPNWPRMDLFLNGTKNEKRISLLEALTKRIDENKDVQERIPWRGVTESQNSKKAKESNRTMMMSRTKAIWFAEVR